MRKKAQSTDGFMIPRRPQAESNSRRLGVDTIRQPRQILGRPEEIKKPAVPVLPRPAAPSEPKVSKKELDESLSQLDDISIKKKRRRLLPSRRVVKRIFIALLVLGVLIGGFLAIKAFLASGRIFQGNVFDLLGRGQPLKMDETILIHL